MANWLTTLFPLWAILLSALAYWQPGWFVSLKPAIVPLLAVVMFGMGLTLSWQDFGRAFRQPQAIGLGVVLQYMAMPLLALILSRLLGLSPDLTVGMVLVGSVSGGTASNVICYLAKGDVALSIAMTAVSTILAALVTPTLTWLYVGQTIPVPFLGMVFSVVKIVLAPVLLGIAINQLLSRWIAKVRTALPLLSVVAIVLIIAIIVALNQERLATVGAIAILAVILHNLGGLALGYWLPKVLGFPDKTCRTIAIEVGMQNSGLAVSLAIEHFSALAALPGALFSIWHNLSGSALASYWSRDRGQLSQ